HTKEVSTLAFSLDGSFLVSASLDGTMKRFKPEIGDDDLVELWARSSLTTIAFVANGKRFAAGGTSGELTVWDTVKNRSSVNKLEHGISCMAVSSSAKLVAVGQLNRTLFLGSRRANTTTISLGGTGVWAFSPDSSAVAFSKPDGNITRWSITENKELESLSGHSGSVQLLAFSTEIFSPSTRIIATSHESGLKILWNCDTGKELSRLHTAGNNSMIFSPDSGRLATLEPRVHVWDTHTGSLLQILDDAASHPKGVSSVAFSAGGQVIATIGNESPGIQLWDVLTGTCVHTIHTAGPVSGIGFSVDDDLSAWSVGNAWDKATTRMDWKWKMPRATIRQASAVAVTRHQSTLPSSLPAANTWPPPPATRGTETLLFAILLLESRKKESRALRPCL
ncbi:hypothetical protein B0T26DRAFT_643691, partial [Lasiosphaeria miniovina]